METPFEIYPDPVSPQFAPGFVFSIVHCDGYVARETISNWYEFAHNIYYVCESCAVYSELEIKRALVPTMKATYNIPVQKIREVTKFLVKLQKRAAKTNAPVIFSFSFDQENKTKKFQADTPDGRIEASYQYQVLTINQGVTVHEGWVPVAKLDVAAQQMKCYSVYSNEMESIKDRFWTKHCDHCGHNKIVHTAFLMQRDGQYMKVGHGCMKELAPLSAEMIAREFDIYALWSDFFNAMTAPEDDEFGLPGNNNRGGSGGSVVNYIYDKSKLFLAMRVALDRTDGKWVTSQYYNDPSSSLHGKVCNQGHRTFDFLGNILFDDGRDFCLLPDPEFVESIHQVINEVLEKYPEAMGDSLEDFKTFAAADKARAFDVFLVKKAQGILEREARKAEMAKSVFQGEVGSKWPFTLSIIEERSGQGMYGTWYLTIFQDDNGNLFKKFGAVPERFKGPDGKYRFTAPVKSFETYKDIKYTVLGGPLSKFKS